MGFWSLFGLGLALPISGAIAYKILTWDPIGSLFGWLKQAKEEAKKEAKEFITQTVIQPIKEETKVIREVIEKPIETIKETLEKPIETVREIKIEMPNTQQLPQIIQLPSFPNLQLDASINNNMLLYAGLGLGIGLAVLGALK